MRKFVRLVLADLRDVVRVVFGPSGIGLDELGLAAAIVLIGAGFWMLWRPGAFLVPGFVLLWMWLPTRKPFVDRPSDGQRRTS